MRHTLPGMLKQFVAFCSLCLLLLISCKGKTDAIYPQYKSITQSVYASGVIKSRNQYQVFATTPGVIGNIYITEGDAVNKGQLLATVTNSAAALNKDVSQLAANYNAVQNNQDKLQQLQYNIDIARQKKDNDSSLYARQLSLWQQGIGTKNELDQRELSIKNSRAAYDNAVLQYQELKKQLAFQAKQSSINAQITSSQAGDLQVKSAVTGTVYSVLKKQGEMVTAQTPIAVLGEKDNFYLELQVDEYDIAQVKDGQQVMITMDSYKGEVFEAVITKVYPMMNERSKTFTVEATFTKAPPKIYPNLTAEANVVIVAKPKALLVPRNYLLGDQYVLLQSGEKRKVETGIKDYQYVEITQGLTDKDAIVKPAE